MGVTCNVGVGIGLAKLLGDEISSITDNRVKDMIII
jgi:hypothetical protein